MDYEQKIIRISTFRICFLLNEGVTAINNLLVILIKKKRAKTQIHKTRNVKEK